MYSGAMQALSRFEAPIFAALRIVAGLMFAFHGAQKILGWHMPYPQPEAFTQIWFGGMIELIGGVMIAIGLFTRWAAFVSSGTMAVAYIQFHWKLNMDGGHWLPGVNGGEPAALYCFLFLFIAAHGAGVASIDGMRRRG